ncbi:hypothetical protein [Methylobacter sp. YRD-M1]|uniref:hypothetical protein n=1 Tax=Methylobacter sp. YRD-M1 TaxID=2911520 RepID=UPI00227BA49C|nr:hypothetical protein [Methylobacter sp. YRD-M1]WAK04620.1 hypothetical protein LZ558_22455 [Methylobacter sp. YRD-M1]
MSQEETVFEILLLSGVKRAKARKLSKIIAALYSQHQRPENEDIKRQMEGIAESATRFADEHANGAQIAAVRNRMSEILYEFFIGLATNGTYDAIKLLFTLLSTFFMAGESAEMKDHMRAASTAYEKEFGCLPDNVEEQFLSESAAIYDFWNGYKQKLMEILRNDETLAPYFKDNEFNLAYIVGEFQDVIRES